ncbi:MAG: 16S rRNA (guanine(966)-N(2))-methyltransferase RsmD [Spirochaetes bacterium]|nr:16S rRNA (guanine(966)-N(2))-methyltransferase RsmD [Spirochaetota bacterium]
MKKKKIQTRVITGRIKNKLIECPPGIIRPMTSMVKEALFSIIGDCSDLKMLDLFTGSGNIAIEAYSRGLEDADMVEYDWNKKNTIIKNLTNAGFKNANLFIQDALKFCAYCKKKYDFIMLDPPFNWDKKKKLLNLISDNELLTPDGFIVIHLHKKDILEDKIGRLTCYDKRLYGINMLLFYRYD